ncbi:MAG: hypothetical protein ACYC6Y_11195 [Thermoguttaceae bacterium]
MLTARLFRHPLFYFALQAAGLGVGLWLLGKFQPVAVGDTSDYLEFPFHDPVAALGYPRTIGYPLFLALAGLLAPGCGAAPALDFVVHVAAVAVFWLGLRYVIRCPWTSMAVASSLLYSNTLLRYGNNLAADSLASSLAISTVGWLLVTLLSPRRRTFHWWVLALGVFACYQVRPACLFMIPLVPVLGVMLWWLVAPVVPARREGLGLLAKLLLAVLIPWLAFSTVRWLTVDRFSLVSFGGHNVAAVVCMFLSEDDARALPADVRLLAEDIVRRRQMVAARTAGYTGGPTRRYMAIEVPFDTNIKEVCVAAARGIHGDDWIAVDRALWRFAAAVVAEKPGWYAVWLVKAFIRGFTMIVSEYIMNPVYFVVLAALAAAHAWSVVLRKRSAVETPGADPDLFVEINALWLIAAGFALAKILLVISTSPSLGRFMDAAGVFLACVLVRALANRIAVCRHLVGCRA